ncbi:AI-2E family transporter [Methylomarinum vadi]|uniref:AI-2E family transporter n=1 Tax=Methylomarinum vadi TaxID=438855 RepID=UPI0004DEE3CC|nr:AI-2E family transporter [Methylomarinum vadi]
MRAFNVSGLYFAVVLLFLLYLLWMMIQPFLAAIIFASIITGSVYPFYKILLDKTKLTRQLAAIVICFLIIVVVFFPTIYLSFVLSKEAVTLYEDLVLPLSSESIKDFFMGNGHVARALQKLNTMLEVEVHFDNLINEIVSQVRNISALVIVTINNIVENIINFLFNFMIMILVIYALLTEGIPLKKFMLKLSPLPDDQEELIIEKFNQMNFVTLVCNGVGGLIQGILAGIGFWLAGINLVVLWTTIMIILAFIPLLGISIVYIPACIYLASKGQIVSSIMLFIYCSVVAFVTENWFKPIFIGNRIQINSLFVLFTIIGGMTVFGLGGIFYGPIIAILFLTMVDLYHKFYSSQ